MKAHARLAAVVLGIAALAVVIPSFRDPAPSAQGSDILINIIGGGARKLNIAVPQFTVVAGADTAQQAKTLTQVTGSDLTFTGIFAVMPGETAIPANNPEALRKVWTDLAAAGAHAGLHGLLAFRGDRVEGEMRLYDLTSPDQKVIATKTFSVNASTSRRLAHKIADEVMLQFTGELGIADTKLAWVTGRPGAREVQLADYDGFGPSTVTQNGSINLTPVWSPDARSVAYLSYKNGYPDLFRLFPFERRPEQTLAAFTGINSSPAWSADGQQLALTLSKDGNPEIYVLTLSTGVLRRLTRHAGIDTEPTWSPTGRQIAFISNRAGSPHLFVMDPEGANVRQLTFGGYHTQPRWSPKGDTILYTQRAGNHNIWIMSSDGSNARQLTSGADNQGATWAPNSRHIAFQSNRLGTWRVFTMLADGTEQAPVLRSGAEHTSPSWSPRLP